MESNIKIKDTPKLKISSAVFGDKDIAGDSTGSIKNIHKTISKLAGHVRKSLIRIKGLEEKFSKVESKIDVDEERFSKLEKKISVNSEKITRIKKILQTQKGNVGKKLPGGSNVNQSLVETNKILVEIKKQIATAFGMRNEEEKEKNKTLKQEKSKEKLRLKEGAIESVRKIGGAIKKTAQFVAAPFKGFFDKILEFITLLGLGIGANAVFKWFEDEENRKKMSKFFNIIVSNWKLIRNILGVIGGAVLGAKLIGALAIIGKVLAIIASPPFLAVLATAAIAYGSYKAIREGVTGGVGFTEAHDVLDRELEISGITNDGKSKLGKDLPLTPEQDRIYKSVTVKRQSLKTIKKEQEEELKTVPTSLRGRSLGQGTYSNDMAYEAAKGKIYRKYQNTARELVGIPARKMGGPVSAKTPYLVGEAGPEIFAPNVDGSIINNMRTEKIYQMISSKDAGKINFITMELPPKVMKKEQQDSTQQTVYTAPPVPSISPVNGSNPYMNTTPEIYGIYV